MHPRFVEVKYHPLQLLPEPIVGVLLGVHLGDQVNVVHHGVLEQRIERRPRILLSAVADQCQPTCGVRPTTWLV